MYSYISILFAKNYIYLFSLFIIIYYSYFFKLRMMNYFGNYHVLHWKNKYHYGEKKIVWKSYHLVMCNIVLLMAYY